MEQTLKVLGKRIAAIRASRGITQERLAEMVHYSTNHISKLESARTKPSFELLYRIAIALNVELKDIFNFDDYKNIDFAKNKIENLLINGNEEEIKLLYKLYNLISL